MVFVEYFDILPIGFREIFDESFGENLILEMFVQTAVYLLDAPAEGVDHGGVCHAHCGALATHRRCIFCRRHHGCGGASCSGQCVHS